MGVHRQSDIPNTTGDIDSLKDFETLIDKHIHAKMSDCNFDKKQLAFDLALSESALYRKVILVTQLSPGALINKIRLEYSRELLLNEMGNISEVAYMAGFNNPKYYSRCFKFMFGVTPSQFIAQNSQNSSNLKNHDTLDMCSQKQYLKLVIRIIEENIDDENLNLDKIATQSASSKSTLSRRVKTLTGQTPMKLVKEIRLRRAYTLLNTQLETVPEVGFNVGYFDSKYFSKCFKRRFGVSPYTYIE
jgi:Transcriptional regulator containing an amidase domain and an AraC-type DNA-binding HTH domain